jgi:hypothetical protein
MFLSSASMPSRCATQRSALAGAHRADSAASGIFSGRTARKPGRAVTEFRTIRRSLQEFDGTVAAVILSRDLNGYAGRA